MNSPLRANSDREARVTDLARQYLQHKRDTGGTLRYSPSKANSQEKSERLLRKGERLKNYVQRITRSPLAGDWIQAVKVGLANEARAGNVTVEPLPPTSVRPSAPPTVSAAPNAQLTSAPGTWVPSAASLPALHATRVAPRQPTVCVSRTSTRAAGLVMRSPAMPQQPIRPAEDMHAELPRPSVGTSSAFLEQNFAPIETTASEGHQEGFFQRSTCLDIWAFDDASPEDDAFFHENP